jgi:hypothetical protein
VTHDGALQYQVGRDQSRPRREQYAQQGAADRVGRIRDDTEWLAWQPHHSSIGLHD